MLRIAWKGGSNVQARGHPGCLVGKLKNEVLAGASVIDFDLNSKEMHDAEDHVLFLCRGAQPHAPPRSTFPDRLLGPQDAFQSCDDRTIFPEAMYPKLFRFLDVPESFGIWIFKSHGSFYVHSRSPAAEQGLKLGQRKLIVYACDRVSGP